MKHLLLIFAGGGLGSVARFLFGRWVNSFHQLNFPFGTLAVNVTACFVLGLVVSLSDHRQLLSPDSKIFWTIGFCGGFSTFSTFSLETAQLFQQGSTGSGLLYIAGSVALCWVAVVLGVWVGK
jgi:CrcB protein